MGLDRETASFASFSALAASARSWLKLGGLAAGEPKAPLSQRLKEAVEKKNFEGLRRELAEMPAPKNLEGAKRAGAVGPLLHKLETSEGPGENSEIMKYNAPFEQALLAARELGIYAKRALKPLFAAGALPFAPLASDPAGRSLFALCVDESNWQALEAILSADFKRISAEPEAMPMAIAWLATRAGGESAKLDAARRLPQPNELAALQRLAKSLPKAAIKKAEKLCSGGLGEACMPNAALGMALVAAGAKERRDLGLIAPVFNGAFESSGEGRQKMAQAQAQTEKDQEQRGLIAQRIEQRQAAQKEFERRQREEAGFMTPEEGAERAKAAELERDKAGQARPPSNIKRRILAAREQGQERAVKGPIGPAASSGPLAG